MGCQSQSLLDALHGVQLWGIVRGDTGGRCGSNDEFLAAFKRLEEEVSNVEEENARLRELVEMLYECPMAPECDECKSLNGDYACAYFMRELGFEVE